MSMKNQPLISVIMSEYNTDVILLKQSIKSILEQTYENFEFIIIDDCGKNNIDAIIKEFNDDRIKIYKNDKNRFNYRILRFRQNNFYKKIRHLLAATGNEHRHPRK